MTTIRPAVESDTATIEALLAPEILRGAVLPRTVDARDFIVADDAGHLIGAVALTHQSSQVVELGSLVSKRRGMGLGRHLVEAAIERATDAGYDTVMALSAIPEFFKTTGFTAASHAPWIAARQALDMPHPHPLNPAPDAVLAATAKAPTCRSCPRLATCAQTLLIRRTAVTHRRQA